MRQDWSYASIPRGFINALCLVEKLCNWDVDILWASCCNDVVDTYAKNVFLDCL